MEPRVNDAPEKTFCFVVSQEDRGLRLDVFVSMRPLGLSRAKAQALIKEGRIRVDEKVVRPSYRVREGENVQGIIPPLVQVPHLDPEPVDFSVVYEDDALMVLNKPPGLVVHPAPGHLTGTLVHGLLHYGKELASRGGGFRPGIVHRLDKDTSGLMVVAKSDRVHEVLGEQFKGGLVRKRYLALVHGPLKELRGEIDLPISRHPKRRKRMSVARQGGRRAVSLWQKIEDLPVGLSLVTIYLKTGRTHQIRVHFSHIGHPVVGDAVYGRGKRWWKHAPLPQQGLLASIGRQMLHAHRLGFVHPVSQNYVEFEAPLPDDMERVLRGLRLWRQGASPEKGLDI